VSRERLHAAVRRALGTLLANPSPQKAIFAWNESPKRLLVFEIGQENIVLKYDRSDTVDPKQRTEPTPENGQNRRHSKKLS
jgi:hypothetical protein